MAQPRARPQQPWQRPRSDHDVAIDQDDADLAGLVLPVLALIELLLQLPVLPFALLGRLLLLPWHVVVRRDWDLASEGRAGDWRESEGRRHQIAAAIRRGELPPG